MQIPKFAKCVGRVESVWGKSVLHLMGPGMEDNTQPKLHPQTPSWFALGLPPKNLLKMSQRNGHALLLSKPSLPQINSCGYQVHRMFQTKCSVRCEDKRQNRSESKQVKELVPTAAAAAAAHVT